MCSGLDWPSPEGRRKCPLKANRVTNPKKESDEICRNRRSRLRPYPYFGYWSFDNGNRILKAYYNRPTCDYAFEKYENGAIVKRIEHADLKRVTRCLITFIMGNKLQDYD